MHQLDYEIRPKTRIYLAFAGRQFDIRQTIFAVPELSRDQFLKQWMLRSGCDWDVTAMDKRDHPQRVLQALTCGHVSGNYRNRAHVQFRRVECQHQRQRVVGSGIGIKNDLFCGGRDGTCAGQRDQN